MFNFFTISGSSHDFQGVVIDSISNQPIAFVHVYNGSSEVGTITNEEGKFVFTSNEIDTLEVIFSHVEFKSKKFKLYKNQFSAIRLSPNIIVLQEVLISDQAFWIAKSIFEKFIHNRPVSFGKAFYRKVTTTGGSPSEFLETFNNVSFSAGGVEQYNIYQSRYASVKGTAEKPAFHFTNFAYLTFGYPLFSLKAKSIVKPFTSDYIELFDYTISKSFKSNGCDYVIVHYEPSEEIKAPFFSGDFTVNITNQSMLAFTASTRSNLGVDSVEMNQSGKLVKILFAKNHSHQWSFRFTDNFPDVLLESISVLSSFDLNDESRTWKVRTISTLVVYETDSKNNKGLHRPDIENGDLQEASKSKYNSKFWRDNPVIKRTHMEEETIKYFEKSNSFGNFIK